MPQSSKLSRDQPRVDVDEQLRSLAVGPLESGLVKLDALKGSGLAWNNLVMDFAE